MTNQSLLKYQEEVFSYLEYLGYPDLILEFEPESVGNAIANVILHLYKYYSPRMTALCIFGWTFKYQILPLMKNSTGH